MQTLCNACNVTRPSEFYRCFRDVFHFVSGALGPGSITGPQTPATVRRLGLVAVFPLAVPSKNTGGSFPGFLSSPCFFLR